MSFRWAPLGTLTGLVLGLSSCAGVVDHQITVEAMARSGRLEQAEEFLDDNPHLYGPGNQLLYWLDKGWVAHIAYDTDESLAAFARAEALFEELTTRSVSAEAASWLTNDNVRPYYGEDFERAYVYIFQALNYAAQGDFSSALVEVRRWQSWRNALEADGSTVSRVALEDPFLPLISAWLYEASGRLEDLWEARRLLNQALALRSLSDDESVPAARRDFSKFVLEETASRDAKTAVITFLEYAGRSPVKVPDEIPVPLPDGYILKIAFPRMERRPGGQRPVDLEIQAESPAGGPRERVPLVEVGNLESLMIRYWKAKRALVLAKAALRPAAKWQAVNALEEAVQKDDDDKEGDKNREWVRILGQVYLWFSETPDLRSWRLLPARIRAGRVRVQPGTYIVWVDGRRVSTLDVSAGERVLTWVVSPSWHP